MAITIAIDAHGGDFGASVTIPAALSALASKPDLSIILVGQQDVLTAELSKHNNKYSDRLIIQHASQIVGMDESPASAMRGKKDSSMRVAINLVKEGTANACVSAGNTGALMATARFVLKTLSGIKRPASRGTAAIWHHGLYSCSVCREDRRTQSWLAEYRA